MAKGWKKASDAQAEVERVAKQLKDAEELAATHRLNEEQIKVERQVERKKTEDALEEIRKIKLELEGKAAAENKRLMEEADAARRSLAEERRRAALLQDALLATEEEVEECPTPKEERLFTIDEQITQVSS